MLERSRNREAAQNFINFLMSPEGQRLLTTPEIGRIPVEDTLRTAALRQQGLALADAIGNLPEREKLVLSLYYDEELNLKEIGQVLGVSESRVSQLHSQCAARLRARLGEWRAN